jgi:hypothetical protein
MGCGASKTQPDDPVGSGKSFGPAKTGNTRRRSSLPLLAFASERSSLEKAKKAFDAMDVDGDGLLQPAEVMAYLSSVGYGEDEAARFVRAADVNGDDAIDLTEFHDAWGFLNAFQIQNHSEGVVLRKPGSLVRDGAGDVSVDQCSNCTVHILDRTSQVPQLRFSSASAPPHTSTSHLHLTPPPHTSTSQLQLDRCENVTFVLGPCTGSVFMRDCSGCSVSVACQQLRTRDCRDCVIYLYSVTEPIVEASRGLKVAPFNAAYNGCAAQFAQAGFDPRANLFWAVYDFDSPNKHKPKHWSEQPPDEWEPCTVRLQTRREAEAPAPVANKWLVRPEEAESRTVEVSAAPVEEEQVEACAVPRESRGVLGPDAMRGNAMHF